MSLALQLLTLLIGLPACQTSADPTAHTTSDVDAASSDSMHVTQIQRLGKYTWPEGGTYYRMQMQEEFGRRDGSRDAPTGLLRELRQSGADVTHAWYRPGASSCVPPGSPMGMDVVVPEQLLVRTAAPWPDASAHGFSPVDTPRIQCPYEVTLYAWE